MYMTQMFMKLPEWIMLGVMCLEAYHVFFWVYDVMFIYGLSWGKKKGCGMLVVRVF